MTADNPRCRETVQILPTISDIADAVYGACGHPLPCPKHPVTADNRTTGTVVQLIILVVAFCVIPVIFGMVLR